MTNCEKRTEIAYSISNDHPIYTGGNAEAKYEILEGDEGFYGEIPGFQGVWATAANLEECREDLSEALETWLLFRISRGMKIPVVGKQTFSRFCRSLTSHSSSEFRPAFKSVASMSSPRGYDHDVTVDTNTIDRSSVLRMTNL